MSRQYEIPTGSLVIMKVDWSFPETALNEINRYVTENLRSTLVVTTADKAEGSLEIDVTVLSKPLS